MSSFLAFLQAHEIALLIVVYEAVALSPIASNSIGQLVLNGLKSFLGANAPKA